MVALKKLEKKYRQKCKKTIKFSQMGQAYEYKIPQTLSALPGSQKLSSWTFPVESTGEDLPA